MVIDARNGPENWGWHVWDCEKLYQPKDIVWVNDETSQWGQYGSSVLDIQTHQEKKIYIIRSKRLVLFNPLDDEDLQTMLCNDFTWEPFANMKHMVKA